jgi:hypothetical protein
MMLSSCLKTNNSAYYNPPAALVTFIQASPDEPNLDFYLDNDRVNSDVLRFGNNINYFRAYAGKRTANFYNTGSMTKVFSDTATLLPNYVYSLFLANKASSPELFRLTDTISKPATGNASIRFVNLSPDAPAVDLVVEGGAVLVPNRSYKGYSSFLPIAGETTYTFEVHQAGTATVLATLPSVKLNNGFVYTIWLQGLATPTNSGDGLGANIMINAYYN